MAVSEDVLGLVRTVERLPLEDQDKILRIADLLSLVPAGVQTRTQSMLHDLLVRAQGSKHECIARVDDVIEYLERNVVRPVERHEHPSPMDFPANRKARLS